MGLEILESVIIKGTCMIKKNPKQKTTPNRQSFSKFNYYTHFSALLTWGVILQCIKSLQFTFPIPGFLAYIRFTQTKSVLLMGYEPLNYLLLFSFGLREYRSHDVMLLWQWICTNRWLRWRGGVKSWKTHLHVNSFQWNKRILHVNLFLLCAKIWKKDVLYHILNNAFILFILNNTNN